jgi:hypothetical protein
LLMTGCGWEWLGDFLAKRGTLQYIATNVQ